MKNVFCTTLMFAAVILLCASFMTSTATSQTWTGIRHFTIPTNPNIQGIANQGDATPNIWLTNYTLRGSIGKLFINNTPCSGGIYSEWKPMPTPKLEYFDPFKIVSGTCPIKLSKTDPASELYQNVTAVSPTILKKTVTTVLTSFNTVVPRAFFTMPSADRVGMLMNGIGGAPSSFWIWDLSSSGLSTPWDIQRSTPDDPSLWISARTPETAIYEFNPTAGTINRWDISPIKLEVFYVANLKKKTLIWIGGIDSLGNDYIGLLEDNLRFRYWKLTGGPRTMQSITFTGEMGTTAHPKDLVWLVSFTDPAVTILSPNSLYDNKSKDYICDNGQGFEGANGVFFPGPPQSTTPVWITQYPYYPLNTDMLSMNQAAPQTLIQHVTVNKHYVSFTVSADTIAALQQDYWVGDSCYTLSGYTRSLPCNVVSVYWNNTNGLNEGFSGNVLDIDMLRTVNGANAPAASIIWHEPALSRIGIFVNPPTTIPHPETERRNDIDQQNESEFGLSQNYPNPFNPTTTLEFSLPQAANVTITVYNTLGQEVATVLENTLMTVGKQSAVFDGKNLPSGVYYYHIRAVEVSKDGATTSGKVLMEVKKMILVK